VALRLAGQMLGRLALPPGAQQVSQHPVPAPLRRVYGLPVVLADFTDLHELFSVPQRPESVLAFLQAHPPAATTLAGETAQASPNYVQITYRLRAIPPGIDTGELNMMVIPGPAGSLVRADAQVVWYPPRPPAQDVNPGLVRAARVSFGTGTGARSMVISSRAVISGLARLVNGLHLPVPAPMSCPPFNPGFRIVFALVGAARAATVASSDCYYDLQASVGGRRFLLWDPGSSVARRVAGLLRVRFP
jgi:hypothetical protein